MRNIINDYHWKSANYLSKNYANVIIGNLSTKEICSNKKSTFSGDYKNKISIIRHFEFKQRLQYKCKINNSIYNEVDESWTSKMCSKCGSFNDVKSSKIYKCKECKIVIDRDANGARNIYLKSLK